MSFLFTDYFGEYDDCEQFYEEIHYYNIILKKKLGSFAKDSLVDIIFNFTKNKLTVSGNNDKDAKRVKYLHVHDSEKYEEEIDDLMNKRTSEQYIVSFSLSSISI